MKTTIDIADPLLDRARAVADERGTTLKALVEQGLRQVVDGKPSKPFKLRAGGVNGRGLTPEAKRIAGPDGEKMRYLAYEPWPTEDDIR